MKGASLLSCFALLVVQSRAELTTQYLSSLDALQQKPLNLSDRYIVTLKPGVDLSNHLNFINNLHTQTESFRSDQSDEHRFDGVTHRYTIDTFRGYAGHFHESIITSLKDHDEIDTIEADQPWGIHPVQEDNKMEVDALVTQENAQYGLALISHRLVTPRAASRYEYDSKAGQGTFAYILDSGITIGNPEFQGRADLGYNAVRPRERVWTDDYGHGTHIAGIIGSKTYGVAKKCNLVAVKVVQNNADNSFAQILDGFQWAVRDITGKRRQGKAVVHVSVYGPSTNAWDRAVNAAGSQEVVVVVPAGNQNRDPSPRLDAVRYKVIAVSATDSARQRARFANWGRVVDVFAPGVDIMSTWGHGSTRSESGTAQSAAFVSGIVAYFKAYGRLEDQGETKLEVLRTALKDIVQCPDGRKRFAYNGSGR